MEFNCGFIKDNKWFRYRAAAIIIEDDCVLFAGNELDDYFYSIGGAVHMGETAEDAVIREVYEETGICYEIDHLAVIHENFFYKSNGSLAGLDCHEICLYARCERRNVLDTYSRFKKAQGVSCILERLSKQRTLRNRTYHFG